MSRRRYLIDSITTEVESIVENPWASQKEKYNLWNKNSLKGSLAAYSAEAHGISELGDYLIVNIQTEEQRGKRI